MDRKLKYFFVVALLALSAFLAVAFITARPQDWPFLESQSWRSTRNLCGPIGSLAAFAGFRLLGSLLAWFVPLSMALFAGALVMGKTPQATRIVLKGTVILVLLEALFSRMALTRESTMLCGAVGRESASALTAVLGRFGGTIVLIASLLVVLYKEVRFLLRHVRASSRRGSSTLTFVGPPLRRFFTLTASLVSRAVSNAARGAKGAVRLGTSRRASVDVREERPLASPAPPPSAAAPTATATRFDHPSDETHRAPSHRAAARRAPPKPKLTEAAATVPLEEAVLPSISMLKSGGESRSGFSAEKLRGWSDVLEGKLANYGIEGRVTAVNQGPQVTTFEFEPAPGVKIREIVSRADDLALAMKALSLRLIAPIPGRSVVGIEIPNPEQEVVYLHDILREIPDRLRLSGVMIALGVDVTGHPFYMNLCSAPHLLMAGTTGSGKSVSLNCFLASILFQYHPSDVRLVLVDPKMVEMSAYNGIPHLLHPVITDPRDAVRVFNFLIGEMERRNEMFRSSAVKNIESFNSKIALGRAPSDGVEGKLPYIVLVVDELGDLALTKGADIESLLSRLSNMARAVGIHMIVATQRPSVDVIVGKTKANFPTRIAFRVASKVDSRTILDCVGAEKLLGKGDLLLTDAKHPEPLRLHGAWVGEDEMERLVTHWKQYAYEESRLALYEDRQAASDEGDTDALFDDAREIVLRYRQGSTSLLQRKLHIGYARAARLLDQLEQSGVVGPPDGSKPREVLIKEEAEVGFPADDEAV
jgi:S-DNA-T family DNA segregation ATPase FtsK/SpoIIIE